MAADFKLLRSGTPATPALQQQFRRILNPFPGELDPPHWGLDYSAARGTQLSDGVVLWLIPGRTGSCNAISERNFIVGGGCSGNGSLTTHGIETYRRSSAGWQITGLVPDGHHVTLKLADGKSIPAPINTYNAYVVDPSVANQVVGTTMTATP